ncbi:MAG TPA: DUF1707 domain-containing protein [Actinocrinis sp.]|uniref:DUF1707 SHOCT-like domain-containing protein n=1 Tax=Actinocrinis sp. TaxID=1920516 RepID=UPI002D53F8EA|nr:DUF1707 domain-containing protein [Actinocrinis sp.]HZU55846.1 DUF1707 domain-containing protein [Actinocrinis sp.]
MSQGGVPDPNLRASDADRERIVEQLRQHTADGRLTMDEFEQRMSAAYAAKTYGELAQLTRDLPVDLGARSRGAGFGPPPPQDAPPWSGSWPRTGSTDRSGSGNEIVDALVGAAMNWKMQKVAAREQLRQQRHQARLERRANAPIASGFVGWAVLSALLTGIWFMAGVTSSGGFGDFWPIWPIGILGFLTVLKAIKTATLRRTLTRR